MRLIGLLMLIVLLIPAHAVGGGRAVEWIPFADLDVPARAVLSPSGFPAVLYSPVLVRTMPKTVGRFVILRQEHLALIVASFQGGTRLPSRPGSSTPPGRSSPYHRPIEESSLDSERRFNMRSREVLDCLAYNSLQASERADLLNEIRLQPVRIGDPTYEVTQAYLRDLANTAQCRQATAQLPMR